MNPEILLLTLRIIGALLLLAFLGVIVYFIYRDIQLASQPQVSSEKPKGKLRVLQSETDSVSPGSEFPLSFASGIGRGIENLIVIDDEFASNRHALITWSDEKWFVEDLGSRNGTLLNDLPVEGQTVIVSGDVLTVGRAKFKVEL